MCYMSAESNSFQSIKFSTNILKTQGRNGTKRGKGATKSKFHFHLFSLRFVLLVTIRSMKFQSKEN